VRKIGFTYATMNLVNPFLSGIPTCHGSGGMAGHYAFGARTGGSVVIYGMFYLLFGLFFSRGFSQRNTAAALEIARSAQSLIRDLPDTLSNVMLEGTLALSALRAGEAGEALAACQRLTARLARGEDPGTGQCIDGVAGVPDVLLSLREARVPQSEMPGFERDLAHALEALASFARIFPIARPAVQRCRARVLFEWGREAAARRHWRRSARAARRLRMPVDEANVHLDLARIARDDEGRARHMAAAHAILTPLRGESGGR
jgi:hypothetical protein